MQRIYLSLCIVIVAVLVFSTIALAFPLDRFNDNEKTRVVAFTENELTAALAKGCTLLKTVRHLNVLSCPADVVSVLGLQEDIRFFAVDSGANKQIQADVVQSSGNVGTGRKVVVLDTGYNYNHPELASSYLGGKDFVNGDDDPFDDNGHGSHVSGIITADGVDPKAKGVAPAAGVIAGKVLDAAGSGFFSDIVAAIYWAVDGPDGIPGPVCTNTTNGTVCTNDDFNADAISMSLGTSVPYVYKGTCNNVLPDLTNAIKYARDKNVIVVVAAGNSGGSGVSIPGCINYSTTVGAVDSKNKTASFSGKGSAVDISAPGVSIYSTWLGSSYATASGTSMATPMVSGTVALIKFSKPNYTVAQVEDALFKTAKDLGKSGKDTSYGWGLVNAYGAVNYVA